MEKTVGCDIDDWQSVGPDTKGQQNRNQFKAVSGETKKKNAPLPSTQIGCDMDDYPDTKVNPLMQLDR